MTEDRSMDEHHVIVVGGSVGGIEALGNLLSGLPGDFPAPILAVLHRARNGRSALPAVLGRRSALEVVEATDGETVEPGRVFIAAPDRHLLLDDGRIAVRYGPRENRTRPAIDPLFRSAARWYGPRAVGVVLSGALNDGTAGLVTIQEAGGTAIVQEPDDAAYPDMPLSALEHVDVDHCLASSEMGAVLADLVGRPVLESIPEKVAPMPVPSVDDQDRSVVDLVCPDCGGPLADATRGSLRRFQCRIGHVHTEETLLDAQAETVEEALLASLHTLEEKASLLDHMAERVRSGQDTFRQRAEESRGHANVVRELLETMHG